MFAKKILRKLTYPRGRKRTWKWEWSDWVLITGELTAVTAAIVSIWISGWPIIVAAMVGGSALLLYALDLVSRGEKPLTKSLAHNIWQVVGAMEMEKEGAVFDWDNIDARGAVTIKDLSKWSRLRPDIKEIMDRYNVPLLIAIDMLPGGKLHDLTEQQRMTLGQVIKASQRNAKS